MLLLSCWMLKNTRVSGSLWCYTWCHEILEDAGSSPCHFRCKIRLMWLGSSNNTRLDATLVSSLLGVRVVYH